MGVVFFTVYATWVSSFAYLGSSSSFYSDGPLYMTCFAWNVLFGLLYMVLGRRIWFIGKLKGHLTAVDFFHDIFRSESLNIIVIAIMGIFTLPYLMIQLYAGAYIIETASDGLIPWKTAGFIFLLIIVIYLWAGGIRALAFTDIYYGLLVFFTMIASGLVMTKKTGGIYETFAQLAQHSSDNLVLGSGLDENSPIAWLCMFIVIPVGALMGPPMWIRSYAVSRGKTFKIMPFFLAIATIMYLGPVLVAASAKVMYPEMGLKDNLYPFILMNNMPIILTTILLCGIAAAALSTANSQIHSLAAIYTVDIHKRYVDRDCSERKLVSISKQVILILSGIVYVSMLKNPGMIIEMGILGMSGTTQLIVPTVGGLFWKKSNSKAAASGLVAGIALLCIMRFGFDIYTPYSAVIALLLNAVLFAGLSLILPENRETAERITGYKRSFLQYIVTGKEKIYGKD